ncbi:ABC transporter substrate-binding protein [Bradyrhizobium sp. CNPSo 4010]|uniref:ABC transporter substrate-binding protein n=1 Tax=Bradyrhizobium agreste TaxID=2751811 RepID=A0ABS0PTJ9_9BRAD|nr:ABC transporter substrate-binding protein [Bradyrhizobium agreste]MBH5400528.1 ABC transporter substrate-binding protein [Bradyrhizobium agreste]
MERRRFFKAIAALAAWPALARAQQSKTRLARVAYLSAQSAENIDPHSMTALKQGLIENDLIEGMNIEITYFWGNGDPGRVKELASALVQRDFDLIITAGSQPLRSLMATGTKKPLVFAIVADPVGDGIVASLARPGGNATGLSMSGTDLESKRIQLLKETVPTIRKLMILHHSAGEAIGVVSAMKRAADSLALDTVFVEAGAVDEFENAFARAKEQGAEALVASASAYLNYNRKQLIALAAKHRLPSVWETNVYVRDGGLMSYGPNFPDMYRRSAGYVAKILRGANPGEMPVEQPIKFELAVNARTAASLGITVPPSIVARADELIE